MFSKELLLLYAGYRFEHSKAIKPEEGNFPNVKTLTILEKNKDVCVSN